MEQLQDASRPHEISDDDVEVVGVSSKVQPTNLATGTTAVRRSARAPGQKRCQQLQDAEQPHGKISRARSKRARGGPSSSGHRKARKRGVGTEPVKKRARVDGPIGDLFKEVSEYKVVDGVVRCFKQPIEEMIDSTKVFRRGTPRELYERACKDGYILVRGVIPLEVLRRAKHRVCEQLDQLKVRNSRGQISTKSKGWTIETATGDVISGADKFVEKNSNADTWRDTCMSQDFQALMGCNELQQLLSALAEGKAELEGPGVEHRPLVFNPIYTWLRVKGCQGMTPEHSDYYHFRNDTNLLSGPRDELKMGVEGEKEPERMLPEDIVCHVCKMGESTKSDLLRCRECPFAQHLSCALEEPTTVQDEMPSEGWFCRDCRPQPFVGTAWIPLDDIEPQQGTILVQPGSHLTKNVDHDHKGEGRVPAMWYKDGKHKPWHATRFRAGDVLLFDLKSVHVTSKNHTKEFRLSVDTRFMLKPLRRNWGKTLRTRYAEAAACNKVFAKADEEE